MYFYLKLKFGCRKSSTISTFFTIHFLLHPRYTVLCTLVTQGGAKLWEVMEVLKVWITLHPRERIFLKKCRVKQKSSDFFQLPNLNSFNFVASLATRKHSFWFESPDIGTNDFCLIKSVATLLRHSTWAKVIYWAMIALA